MPSPCYVSITGTNQGLITRNSGSTHATGERAIYSHSDEMLIQSVAHGCYLPIDIQSGVVTGQRKHKPLKLTTDLNPAIPLLYNALCTGEMLEKITLTWWRTSIYGKQENFFDTILTNARVCRIDVLMPCSNEKKAKPFTQFVHIYFTYRKIEWLHKVCGTLAIDDWRKPLEA